MLKAGLPGLIEVRIFIKLSAQAQRSNPISSVQQNVMKHKVDLLNLAAELGNISRACKVMGFSRDTFYRYQLAMESEGIDALIDANRRKPNPRTVLKKPQKRQWLHWPLSSPPWARCGYPMSYANGAFLFPPLAFVRSVWLRRDFESFKKRLSAPERHIAETGEVLTEAQVCALEKKQDDDVVHGEIETAHPGYLGSQDTFYVGTIKGVGRIYQQTFVDTYSKWAAAKLYTTKTPITAADLLNDQVLPFFAEQGMGLIRVLTDRGTEYCGKPETHDYQLYLVLNDIEHTKTKANHPQTNGICERFHKTILQEFYQVAFRRKIYRSVKELQIDLDDWLHYYNHDRTHQGKMCCGRTPIQTLIDGKEVWHDKITLLNNGTHCLTALQILSTVAILSAFFLSVLLFKQRFDRSF